jgi:hypothetical protein
MQRIIRAVLAVAVMSLMACSDMMVAPQEPVAAPQPAQEEAALETDGAEEVVSAFGTSAVWTSFVYYFHDFSGPAGPEWSRRRRTRTPSGRQFLGRFTTADTMLTLNGLPRHDAVTLSFDLYVLGDWDGNAGPDGWQVQLVDGPVLLRTTFSSEPHIVSPQAYPDWYPGNNFPGLTGATETGTLGYPPVPGFDAKGDAVYRMTFTVPHDDGRLAFHFKGLPDGREGSWGLDNVKVTLWREGGDPSQSGADLSVKTTANRDTVGAREDVVYTVKVTNKGPGIATDVVVRTGISDHFNLTDAKCGQGTATSDTCRFGALAPGASVTARFTTHVCCFVPGGDAAALLHRLARGVLDGSQPR